jgi:hypothetical protein
VTHAYVPICAPVPDPEGAPFAASLWLVTNQLFGHAQPTLPTPHRAFDLGRAARKDVVAAVEEGLSADLGEEHIHLEVPLVDGVARTVRKSARLPLLRVRSVGTPGVKDQEFVPDAPRLEEERHAFLFLQVPVEVAGEDSSDRLRGHGQGNDVPAYYRDTADIGAKTAKDRLALIECEAAPRKQCGEYSRTSTNVKKRRRREFQQHVPDRFKLSGDNLRVGINTDAGEVPLGATDSALIRGRTPVVVGP